MRNNMHNNYFFLVYFLIFNSAFASESLGHFSEPSIILVLSKNLRFARVLSCVSKKFHEILAAPDVIKSIITQSVGLSSCHASCARAMGTAGSKRYYEVNQELRQENDITAYEKALTSPYADINYGGIIGIKYKGAKLSDIFWSKLKNDQKALWFTTLLDHGANIHARYELRYTDTIFEVIRDHTIESHCYQRERQASLYLLDTILKHNAQVQKKYIETKHICMDEMLKERRADHYNDSRPFMTWSVDYLKLISKYGFDIKTVYPHPLHFHLHDNPDPAPVMVAYLVHEQHCDPYELVDARDGSEPESPYTIVTKLPDTHTAKQELLEIFKGAKQC